jgi:transposase
MEEGNLSEWLYEELEPLVDNLVVVIADKNQGSKSDLIDAWKLADELRRDAITRPVFKAPGQFRELREATRAHYVMQKDKVRSKGRIHALARGCGMRDLAKLLYKPDTRLDPLMELPEHYRARCALYCEQLDGLTDCVRQAETQLFQAAERVPMVKRIATAPGIGIIRASYIVSIVITPHRFRTSRQFWNYSGLAVVTRSSSDWVQQRGNWQRQPVTQTRGLNRNRHPLLKNAFKGAAKQIAAMKDHPLGVRYQKLLETTKPNLAQLTIARSLAAAVLAMWKNNEDYDPNKLSLTRNNNH